MSNQEENTAPAIDSDRDLVNRTRNNDLAAFESLVNRHQKRMLNISFRIIGEYEDACEVTQDAFVSAYRNLAGFRGSATFATWLTSIVINLSRNRLQRAKSRRGHEAYSLDAPLTLPDGELTVDPPSNEPTALDRLEQKDRQQAVQECISRLEPEFREALVLRDLQEFSYDEIGELLKLREGTVKSRISRAREAVKECLKKVWGAL